MFSYFGSKARLAPTYQPPKHDLIIEPFAGAAGYSMYWLSQRSDLRAVLIDSDPLVVEMWDTLLSMDPADLWDYPAPVPGEQTMDLIPLACAVSSGSWVRRSRGDAYTITPWMGEKSYRLQVMAQTLSVVRGRVDVHQRVYQNASDIEATWFIDPPYQKEGHEYASGNRLDWQDLGEWCRSRRGQVIVCESEGADWMDFQPHQKLKSVSNSLGTEVVWYSHPEPDLLSLMEEAET